MISFYSPMSNGMAGLHSYELASGCRDRFGPTADIVRGLQRKSSPQGVENEVTAGMPAETT